MPPTPTIAPEKLFSVPNGKGWIHAELYSSPQDPLGQGKGQFTVEGSGSITTEEGITTLSVVDMAPPAHRRWNFMFTASPLRIGQLYDKLSSKLTGNAGLPSMRIDNGILCRGLSGQFEIEQQTPTLVISFVHLCEKDTDRELRGRIIFTPVSLLTPTPTIPPSSVVSIPEGAGQAKAELYSAPGDLIGGGSGDITLEGEANLHLSPYYNDSKLIISIRIGKTDQYMLFAFFAPTYAVGQPYQNVGGIPPSGYPWDKQYPAICIMMKQRDCAGEKVMGEFTIVQQSPTLVITFSQWPVANPEQVIKGKLTFTPGSPSK
jgi:hypothetical protein